MKFIPSIKHRMHVILIYVKFATLYTVSSSAPIGSGRCFPGRVIRMCFPLLLHLLYISQLVCPISLLKSLYSDAGIRSRIAPQ